MFLPGLAIGKAGQDRKRSRENHDYPLRLAALYYYPAISCFFARFSCSHFHNVLVRYRYRYRSCPAFPIASSDIDSDPGRTTITRCGQAALGIPWTSLSSPKWRTRPGVDARNLLGKNHGHNTPKSKRTVSKGGALTLSLSPKVSHNSHFPSRKAKTSRVRSFGSSSHR
ncbi:MAG: hypothetical protein BECKG1743D_GA0114223_100606 [Candidatus Kentron sp. G]|nr:MAG: hypothetical protein BECKG1743D_GA0114223_100606 [Candidatus Kentron sp. G]